MADKQRRPIDDFTRVLAIIVCFAPVATYCAILIMSVLISSAGGTPPDITAINGGLRDVVLMVVGAAAGMAFRYSQVTRDPEPKDEDKAK
jgi:hypothetical protein